MLVLRRSPQEQILIDGNIRITVLAIEGQRVKLGIEAPKETLIVRAELVETDVPFPLAVQRARKEPADG